MVQEKIKLKTDEEKYEEGRRRALPFIEAGFDLDMEVPADIEDEAMFNGFIARLAEERTNKPPERPRRFVLMRHQDVTGVSGRGKVAWGIVFPDGVVVTRWCVTETRQTCVWASLADVEKIHGHDGKTHIVFLDLEGE
jgi:hypothetical protein